MKIGSTSHKIGIPVITNSKPLEKGEDIIVLKNTSNLFEADSAEQGQPDAKKLKTAPSKGKKGKGKGRGRGTASK